MSSLRKRDLNAGNKEKEVWNRQDHILRMFSYWQTYISFGDINHDLGAMYQGLQGFLDLLTPDFEQDSGVFSPLGKKIIHKGRNTEKFKKLRQALDQGNRLYEQSRGITYDSETRMGLRNSAYRKFQALKYDLYSEAEYLGYNARTNDTSETYREGNN